MPRELKPKTEVYSLRIPAEIRQAVRGMSDEKQIALAAAVTKLITTKATAKNGKG